MHRDRHPKQPWLYLMTDLRPQGQPDAEMFCGDDVVLLLHVRDVEPHWLEVRMDLTGHWWLRIPDESESRTLTTG